MTIGAVDFDPNQLVGWLILAGVVLGALWKAGIWLKKLIDIGTRIIEEMGELRRDVNHLQQILTGHRAAIAYLLGKAGEPLDLMDELIEKGKEPSTS